MVRRIPLGTVCAVLGSVDTHRSPLGLLLSQHVAVVCLSLVKLVYSLEQLLLLLVMLLQLLRQMRCDVGRTNRCRAWSGHRRVGRVPKAMWKMVTNLGIGTRRWVAGRRRREITGIPHHQMNGLLVVRPYLPYATS
jgi:hypothetical protein